MPANLFLIFFFIFYFNDKLKYISLQYECYINTHLLKYNYFSERMVFLIRVYVASKHQFYAIAVFFCSKLLLCKVEVH